MASSKMPENAEQPSGDKLENGETGPTPGKDSSGQFSGNELDESKVEKGQSNAEEDNAEPFSEEAVEESKDGKDESIQKEDPLEAIKGKNGKKKVWTSIWGT